TVQRAPSARQRLVPDAVRLYRFLAFAALEVLDVLLVVALEPHHLRVAFEGANVRGDAIEEPAIVRDHHPAAREGEQRPLRTAQPGKLSSASPRARSVSTSRSLVGSSSSNTLPPARSTFARCTRLRSPPDSSPISCCCWAPLKLKRPT